MSKILVIVESPGKIKKINQYLGDDYIVKASYGHIQDLDKKTLSIDVENNFKPYYITCHDKIKVVNELKTIMKKCNDVIIATDDDREGEAIAFSLASVLNITNPKRIIFHEITKNAILNAVNKPTTINYNMVNAQQTRRLLDRLVGYKISPILWKYIVYNGTPQSAGRVQSVVVKIIIDKEEEINKSISTPYLKTTGMFSFEKNKLNSILNENNDIYKFNSMDEAKTFLKQINYKTKFKVKSIDNKKSTRKPSPPFITSSLQQEASTKLHFNVKKTMDVAQKLYEAGLITYMRTDSPSLSNQAIESAKKYIIKTFGEKYSEPKNYHSKNSNSQNAHECIRPTYLDNPEPDNLNIDQKKLYSLIWKRTIASQMSPALLNIQIINIDAINNKKSILNFNDKQTYFVSTFENIDFDGYLILYNNLITEEDKTSGYLKININDKLELDKIRISEEYTKPPLRYSEASLVKYLEKNGIGRPSTYSSIISKIIDRNYVEIKNIDGIKKESNILELDYKYTLLENKVTISVGNEIKKIVPTSTGIIVNEFMIKYFDKLMDIKFTANFETKLDKIADGKENWINVLRTFYELFNPIVEQLNSEAKDKIKKIGSSTDTLLGIDNGKEIYIGSGKYGPYVKIKDESKWKYASIKDIDNITINKAVELLEYPKELGKIGNAIVLLNKGQYGLYLKYKNTNYSIKDTPLENITMDYAKQLIESGDPYSLKTFKIQNNTYNIKKGEFGPYIQIITKTKKENISIPTKYDINTINIDDIIEIITNKNKNKNKYNKYKKK
jgi:DNA topoisomerase-1